MKLTRWWKNEIYQSIFTKPKAQLSYPGVLALFPYCTGNSCYWFIILDSTAEFVGSNLSTESHTKIHNWDQHKLAQITLFREASINESKLIVWLEEKHCLILWSRSNDSTFFVDTIFIWYKVNSTNQFCIISPYPNSFKNSWYFMERIVWIHVTKINFSRFFIPSSLLFDSWRGLWDVKRYWFLIVLHVAFLIRGRIFRLNLI